MLPITLPLPLSLATTLTPYSVPNLITDTLPAEAVTNKVSPYRFKNTHDINNAASQQFNSQLIQVAQGNLSQTTIAPHLPIEQEKVKIKDSTANFTDNHHQPNQSIKTLQRQRRKAAYTTATDKVKLLQNQFYQAIRQCELRYKNKVIDSNTDCKVNACLQYIDNACKAAYSRNEQYCKDKFEYAIFKH